MGGHGGLNILPQKSWNVYNYDNRKKVKEDEEKHAAEEEKKRKQAQSEELQAKVQHLRKRARGGDSSAVVDAPQSAGHINFFAEIEAAQQNEEHMKEKQKEEERLVERIMPDLKLGRSAEEPAPWYAQLPEDMEGRNLGKLVATTAPMHQLVWMKNVGELPPSHHELAGTKGAPGALQSSGSLQSSDSPLLLTHKGKADDTSGSDSDSGQENKHKKKHKHKKDKHKHHKDKHKHKKEKSKHKHSSKEKKPTEIELLRAQRIERERREQLKSKVLLNTHGQVSHSPPRDARLNKTLAFLAADEPVLKPKSQTKCPFGDRCKFKDERCHYKH